MSTASKMFAATFDGCGADVTLCSQGGYVIWQQNAT